MSRSNLLTNLLLAGTLLLATFDITAATTDELIRPPEVSHVSVSPSGRHLAMVRSDAANDTLIIFERPLSTDSITAGVTSAEGDRFGVVNWINDDFLIVEPTSERNNGRRALTGAMFALGVTGERTRLLERNPQAMVLESALVAHLPAESDSILIAAHSVCEPAICTEAERRERRLVRVNVRTGSRGAVAETAPIEGYFVSDPQGETIYTAGMTEAGTVETYRLGDSGIWERVQAFDPLTSIGQVPYFVTASGTTFGLSNSVGTADLARVDFRAGRSEPLFRNEGSDVNGAMATYGNEELLAVRTNPGFPQWHYLVEHPFVETHKGLRAAFPDGDVEITSITRDGTTAVVRIFGSRNAGDFYLVDINTGAYSLLAKGQPWLDPRTLPVSEPVELMARDGFVLRARLTQPADTQAHPTVLLLDATPNTPSTSVEYRQRAHALVNDGFAVLEIAHRGSAGYGRQYRLPERDPDGQFVQRDLADGARWLIEREIADPDRVCLVGEGYGAFAAVKAMTVSTSLFDCAAALSAHLDPVALRDQELGATSFTAQSTLNPPSALDLNDERRAPANRVSNIQGRLMIVDPENRLQVLESALERNDIPTRWYREPVTIEELVDFLMAEDDDLQETESFFGRLDESQRSQLRSILVSIRSEANDFSPQRRMREREVRRYLGSLVDERDAEVRELLADEQWSDYERYKREFVDELLAGLNIVFVD